ncbi:MAG: hypothetical protein EOL98_07005 [Negativicutes bacterium]|nr:hypothetical protein [Negativicutes bacterium]
MNIQPFEPKDYYDLRSIAEKWNVGSKAAKSILKERGIEPDENFGVGRGRGPRWLGDTLNKKTSNKVSKSESSNGKNLKRNNWKDLLYE